MTSGLTNRRSLDQHVLEQVIYVIIQLSAMTTACKYVEIVNEKNVRFGFLLDYYQSSFHKCVVSCQ